MSVAPSFQKLELAGEPFAEGDKEYVYVRYPDGHTRKVRWYEEAPKRIRSVKDVLGFEKGYITIFKGDIKPVEEWFMETAECRYHVLWGWYCVSTDELPQIPAGVTAVRLPWESVSQPNGELKPLSAIAEVVEGLINDPSPSRWQGSVGERIDRTLTVVKIVPIDGYYGSSNFYLFTDADENKYCWNTAAKQLELGSTYEVRGTVKEHQKYKGEQQTVLTRCKVG